MLCSFHMHGSHSVCVYHVCLYISNRADAWPYLARHHLSCISVPYAPTQMEIPTMWYSTPTQPAQ
jgi:hypothetical protein